MSVLFARSKVTDEAKLRILDVSVPAWLRTPLVGVGVALAVGGVAIAYDIWRTLSEMDAHAAAHSAVGALLGLLFVVVPLVAVGVSVAALGAVVPGETRLPGVPDVHFAPEQRRLVVWGVLGTFLGVVVAASAVALGTTGIGPLDAVMNLLAVVGVGASLLGQGLVVLGLFERLTDPAASDDGPTEPESYAVVGATGRSLLRTALVVVGAPFALLLSVSNVPQAYFVLPNYASYLLLRTVPYTIWGTVGFGAGTLIPDEGPGLVPPVAYSARQRRLVVVGVVLLVAVGASVAVGSVHVLYARSGHYALLAGWGALFAGIGWRVADAVSARWS